MPNKIIVLGDLSTPADKKKLANLIQEIFDEFDDAYFTSDPNGTVSARRGKGAILLTGGLYYYCKNVDGGTTWKKVQIT